MRRLSVILFLLTVAQITFGQETVLHYTTSDGLPQSFVYCMEEDSIGKLWFGTGNGIASFNGKRLVEEETPFETGNRFITAVVKNRKEELWFGHYLGQLSKQTATGWELINGASTTKVIKLVDAIDGTYVIHQKAIGQLQGDSVIKLYEVKGQELQLKDAVLYNNQLFIATNKGIWRYLNHAFEPVGFNSESVSNLSIIDNILYVGLESGNLYTWHLDNDPNLVQSDLTSINAVFALNNQFWIGTNNGVKVFNSSWDLLFTLKESKHITGFIQDPLGNLWISTYGDGLYNYTNERFNLIPIYGNSVVSDNGKGFYIDSGDDICHIRLVNGFWKKDKLVSLPKNSVVNKLYLHNRYLFIATQEKGILIYDLDNYKLKQFEINNYIAGKTIHDIVVDKNNTVWISLALSGVFSYNLNTEEYNFFDTSNGLTHNDIYHLLEDFKGYVWMAPKGSGISKYNDGKFEYFSFNEGLNDLDITGIANGDLGKIIVSTSGGGLNIYVDNVFNVVTYSDGLPSNYVQHVQHIKNDVYWVTTSSGLCQFDAKNISVRTFNPKFFDAGLVFNEAGIASSKTGNTAAFITNKGVLLYNKQNNNVPKQVINVNIKQVSANNDVMDFTEDIILPFQRQDIAITTEVLSYGKTTPIPLEYKLFKTDSVWFGPLYQKQINFSGLSNDNYQISIRVEGLPSTEKNINLTILKPFWKTWWFILVCVLAVVLIVYGLIQVRVYRLKQYNKELEEKVASRTQQLSNRNKQLEQFTYTVSHDLKNPAINMVELVKILHPSMQEHSEAAIFNMLEKTASNMYGTLIELINVLKATQEKGLTLEELKFIDLINENIISIKHSIEQSNASITTELDVESIMFHKPHLQSIIYNMLSNAIKYKKPDTAPEVHIKSFKTKDHTCLSISDNGLGMNLEETKDRLFGMFQRLHDHVEGTGVGLHLVNNIVEQAGGRIEVESQPNQGTTFTVYFPDKIQSETE